MFVTRRGRRSRVRLSLVLAFVGEEGRGADLSFSLRRCAAVTLDGTVIHRSGLITGGNSTASGGRHFEDREVEGQSSDAP
jgi:hypothetical protein